MPELDMKTRLIEAFLELAYAEGPDAITYQKVAKVAGTSFGTVRYHFADTEMDLTNSALLYVAERGRGETDRRMALDRSKSGTYDPLKSYVRATMDWVLSEPKYSSYLIYFYYLNTTKRWLALKNEDLVRIAVGRIESFLFEGIGRGIYKKPADLKQCAYAIHAAVNGASIQALTVGKSEINDVYSKSVFQIVDSVVGQPPP